jgi:hypothetical protein
LPNARDERDAVAGSLHTGRGAAVRVLALKS